MEVCKPRGFILTGGTAVGENVTRDSTEFWIMDFAEKNLMPVLGICRGMQIMAFRAGVPSKLITKHAGVRHKITGLISGTVNSYHDFTISSCPADFEVTAWATDNAIEAIKHRSLPWEGWMWHPEREKNFSEDDVKRINDLFDN